NQQEAASHATNKPVAERGEKTESEAPRPAPKKKNDAPLSHAKEERRGYFKMNSQQNKWHRN
ncbi:hypothetical protein NDU88_005385, partial [Pleurodeles waltl]